VFLRWHGNRVGIEKNFVVFTGSDCLAVMKKVVQDMGGELPAPEMKAMLRKVQQMKVDRAVDPEKFEKKIKERYVEEELKILQKYEQQLRAQNALDFDDMLIFAYMLLEEHEDVRGRLHVRFPYILVDEWQDTSSLQFDIIRLLADKDPCTLFVVGDEDQSIYKFRGADSSNIGRFKESFSGTNQFLLETNYRSTQTICLAAQALIQNNKTRIPKVMNTSNVKGAKIEVYVANGNKSEASWLVRNIKHLVNKQNETFGEIAVLYRANYMSRAIEEALIAAGLPYHIRGDISFYERREVKDIVAYLRFLGNGRDAVSFRRIVNVPARGLGDKAVESYTEWCDSFGLSPMQGLLALKNGGQVDGMENSVDTSKLAARVKKGILEFADLIEQFTKFAESNPLPNLIDRIVADTDYLEYLKKIDKNDRFEELQSNVEELKVATELYGSVPAANDRGLTSFLENVSLMTNPGDDTKRDTVQLMTMHSAKGLEFNNVFSIGWEQGSFPINRADASEIEEERRLAYVTMTRARHRFMLSHKKQSWRRMGSEFKATDCKPSQFIDEIPEEFLEREEERGFDGIRKEKSGWGERQTWSNKSPKSKDSETTTRIVKY